MTTEPDVAALAALITEPARAAMLMHLLDGRSWTAAELGKVAGVGAPTASVHLRKLVEGALIQVSPAGRHRYFRIANVEIALLLEQLARLAPEKQAQTPGARRASSSLRHCRLCYDHLAGRVGVAIAQGMMQRAWLIEAEPWYHLTDEGRHVMTELGVASVAGRTCMDWSERRLHVGGQLGREIARALLALKWMQRDPKSRALRVTPEGSECLRSVFGVRVGNGEVSMTAA
jgi:DNA-binding transcriptional ArsR family regulator